MRSTAEELRTFKESHVWLDILDELTQCIEVYKQELLDIPTGISANNPTTAVVLTHMGCMDGLIKGLAYVSNEMIDVMIEEFENKQRNKNSGEAPAETEPFTGD